MDLKTDEVDMSREQNRSHTETLRNHISHETRLVQRSVVSQQRGLESTLDAQFSQQTHYIQNGFQNMGSETSIIRTEIMQLRSTIEPVTNSMPNLARLEANLSRLVDEDLSHICGISFRR